MHKSNKGYNDIQCYKNRLIATVKFVLMLISEFRVMPDRVTREPSTIQADGFLNKRQS